MSVHLEQEIGRMLQEFSDPARVADELIKKWDLGELSWVDQQTASYFLVHAGFYASFLNQILKLLRTRQRISWPTFITVLSRVLTNPSKETIDQILIGASEENALEELIRSKSFDFADSRFQKIRSQIVSVAPTPLSEIKPQPLITKPKIRKAKKTPAAEPNQVGKELLAKAKKERKLAYEIAVSLHLMGMSEFSLKSLDFAPNSSSTEWLRLEVLLDCKRFVEALDYASRLEVKYSGDPDFSLSALYAKALALSGLGKQTHARQLLEQIVRIHPHYRSAHSLLRQWKEEGA